MIEATSSSSSGTLDDSSPSSDVPTDDAPFLADRFIPFNSAFRGDGEWAGVDSAEESVKQTW